MTITCNHCGAEVVFQPLYRREGDLELTFLRCPECGTEYLASVTDVPLRRKIEEYGKLEEVIQTQPVTAPFILKAQALHEQNVKRSRELRDQYMA